MSVEYRVNAPIDPDQLLPLYAQASWASNRTAAGIAAMLAHTFIHISAWNGPRLVAFARAVTDTVYRAVVDDVIVDVDHRGQGIGTELMARLGHELRHVEEVFLGCGDPVVSFYERVGYARADHPYMKRE